MMCYGAIHSMKPSTNSITKKELSFNDLISLSEVGLFIVPGDVVQFPYTADGTEHSAIFQCIRENSKDIYEFIDMMYLVKNTDVFIFLDVFENIYGQAYAFYSMTNNQKIGVSKKYMSYLSETHVNEKFSIRKL